MFNQLFQVAKSVLPLVDDMLRTMCPPIQPRNVANRAAALLKAVSRLGKLTERSCNVTWPSGILNEMNTHYQVRSNVHASRFLQVFMSATQPRIIAIVHANKARADLLSLYVQLLLGKNALINSEHVFKCFC